MNKCVYVINIIILFIIIGCSTHKNYLAQPDLNIAMKNTKTLGVVVNSAIVREIAIGGKITINEDETAKAKPFVEKGVIAGLNKSGIDGKIITGTDDLVILHKGILAISRELRSHFPSPQSPPTVPSKIDNFNSILKKYNMDCILSIATLDNISSPERKAMLIIRSPLIMGGTGLSYMSYTIYCYDGRPMYYTRRSGPQYSFYKEEEDVKLTISEITDEMLKVAREEK